MMSRYEEFRIRILERAATATHSNSYLGVIARGLANHCGIPPSHVRDELVRLADSGLISISAWDGEQERPYDEWPDRDSLFSNTTDKGQVRIRLLSAGRQLLSKAPNLQ
jgi:predicted ArsR family transcriptional regulator